ncbi:MAG TPA: hypothetical protein VKU40_02140 [Thermoanaerobaculia bacterium]|nr:hypothetical protein [Thermoanaerobaculia bacterium]
MNRLFLPLLICLLLPTLAGAADVDLGNSEPAAVTAALESARDDGTPFHLVAQCTDEKGNRSLEAFPRGVAIWNRSAQLELAAPVRRALVDTLLTHGFAAMEPTYGGKARQPGAEDEPQPMEGAVEGEEAGEAALRVRCRLVFESGDVAKTSIQQAQGEQSKELTGLIASLLDRVAPLAAESGIGAADLADGLDKLAAGQLAPETFWLRFVRLPDDGGTGRIVFVERQTLTTRRYAPKRELGDPESDALAAERFTALVESLRSADLTSMPTNLWSEDQLDLEVHVLDREATVLARPFSRLKAAAGEERGEAQKRFDTLVGFLRQALLGEEMEMEGEAMETATE